MAMIWKYQSRALVVLLVVGVIGTVALLVMRPSRTATTLASSSNPSRIIPVYLNYVATVSPAPDGGSIAFTDHGVGIPDCGAIAVSRIDGRATCPVAYTSAGNHIIGAHYSGDAAYLASSSAWLVQVATVGNAPLGLACLCGGQILEPSPWDGLADASGALWPLALPAVATVVVIWRCRRSEEKS